MAGVLQPGEVSVPLMSSHIVRPSAHLHLCSACWAAGPTETLLTVAKRCIEQCSVRPTTPSTCVKSCCPLRESKVSCLIFCFCDQIFQPAKKINQSYFLGSTTNITFCLDAPEYKIRKKTTKCCLSTRFSGRLGHSSAEDGEPPQQGQPAASEGLCGTGAPHV